MFNRNYAEDCINLRAARHAYSLIHLLSKPYHPTQETLITKPLTPPSRSGGRLGNTPS
jgi:hypothetical protein